MGIDIDRAVDDLVELAPGASVVRHDPGLIVLKIGASMIKAALKSDLANFGRSLPGIRGTKLKLLSRTLHIEYDEEVLPYDFWEEMARLKHEPEGQEKLRVRLKELLSNKA